MGHQFTIESDEAFALATELAELKGESLDSAVTAALRSMLKAERERLAFIAQVREATAEFRASLTSLPASSDHDFLYDEQTGLPA